MKNILIMKKKNRIKKDNKIKKYEKEIQELNKKLNDYKNKEEKIYGNIPYLETEEEAAENIADIYERRHNKARTFAPPHNVEEIEESDEEIEESDEEIDEKKEKYMKELLKKYDVTREKDTPTKIPQSVKKKDTPTKTPKSVRKKDTPTKIPKSVRKEDTPTKIPKSVKKKVIKDDIEDDIKDFDFDFDYKKKI